MNDLLDRPKRTPVIAPEVKMTENVSLFLDKLAAAGVEVAPALPDTWIIDIIQALDDDPRFEMTMVGREESAIGLCAGAFLGGRGSIAVMGASGLVASIYAITKICYTYQIGFPILITTRGGITDRATHHQANGTHLRRMIDSLDLPMLELSDRDSYDAVPDAVYHSRVQKRPVLIGISGRI